jgi:hypothetical protein
METHTSLECVISVESPGSPLDDDYKLQHYIGISVISAYRENGFSKKAEAPLIRISVDQSTNVLENQVERAWRTWVNERIWRINNNGTNKRTLAEGIMAGAAPSGCYLIYLAMKDFKGELGDFLLVPVLAVFGFSLHYLAKAIANMDDRIQGLSEADRPMYDKLYGSRIEITHR